MKKKYSILALFLAFVFNGSVTAFTSAFPFISVQTRTYIVHTFYEQHICI